MCGIQQVEVEVEVSWSCDCSSLVPRLLREPPLEPGNEASDCSYSTTELLDRLSA